MLKICPNSARNLSKSVESQFKICAKYVQNQLKSSLSTVKRYNDRTVIIGGDFNTDLDKSNPASDLLNRFIIDHKFERCDTLQTNGQKRFTFFNDVQGDQSQIDF